MDIIFGASIIASFLAGVVALFAPCCITVLLPAYIASAFREKTNLLKMTFIFFMGLSTILVPIGLGAAGLAMLFQDFHKELWIFGGLFMIALAVMSVLSKGLSMPLPKKIKEKLKMEGGNHSKSVYVLGVLSGAATSCCAPVLVGAMTLAIVSGAFWKAIIVTFAYVFGMVFPLFLTAYFYDKYKIEKSKFVQGKTLSIPLGFKTVKVHSTNLLAGIMFLIFGVTMFVLGITGNAYWSPEHQIAIGKSLNTWSLQSFSYLNIIPDFIWGVIIVGIFMTLVVAWKRSGRKEEVPSSEEDKPCH
jgi:cytochrome c biogenesis protein CcdA